MTDPTPRPATLSPEMTTAAFLTTWLEHYVAVYRRRLTLQTYTSLVHKYMVPAIGHVPIGDLMLPHVQQMLDGLVRDGKMPASVKLVRDCLSSALKWAEGHHLVRSRATAGAVAPEPRPVAHRILSDDEVARIIRVCPGHWYGALYVVALTTGMRRAELQGLRWRNVVLPPDSMVGTVQIVEQLATARPVTWSPPKGYRRAIRTNGLPPVAVRALRAQRIRVDRQALQVGTKHWPDLDLVFPTRRGKPPCGQELVNGVAAVCRRAGIAAPYPGMHDLRHTFACRLEASGASITEIQRALGHEYSATTEIYLHQTAGVQAKVARMAGDGLDDAWGA